MKLSEFIKQYRLENKLSGRKFAEKVGYSNAYISLIENDKQTNVGIDFLNALSKTTGVTLDHLLEVLDDMNVEVNRSQTLAIPDFGFLKRIPFLSSGSEDTLIPDLQELDIESAFQADFVLTAQGKSMSSCGIMEGSLVFFRKTDFVENGQIAAVMIEDRPTIKKFYKYGDTVVLRPCNPDFPETMYEGAESDSVQVIGKIIGCFTSFEA